MIEDSRGRVSTPPADGGGRLLRMLRVGLTGGIGSGKSVVSALLAERGAVVIDADQLAREVVEPGTPGLESIVRHFGDGVLTESGALDRPALGTIVFGDDEARRALEAITHPLVRGRAAELERAAGPDAIVVHDNPLLVEMGQDRDCDVVVVIDVPLGMQIERLTTLRGMDEAEALARVNTQATREQRTGVADFVVDNTGSLADLERTVDGLWSKLTAA